MRRLPIALSWLVLTGCVASIGNRGPYGGPWPASTQPILQERVASASRIVELRQRRLDEMRTQFANGSLDGAALAGAEIDLEEAKLRLLECRADLSAAESAKKQH
jgi:hypothetical protein